MNKVGIFNQTNEEIEELEIMKKVLEHALKKENLEDVEFNIVLVDNQTIHNLNKSYRGIDKETDVITFALEDEDTLVNASNIRILGDIYISVEKAKLQAREYQHSFKRELIFLAVHGFYHLLGYDHQNEEEEKVMFKKQEEALDECEIKR